LHHGGNVMHRLMVAFLLFCAVLPLAAQAPAKKTILDGAYTAAQATRGKDNFVMHCSSCHSEDLSGKSAPSLKGTQFVDNWREYRLGTLYSYIKENMPRGKDKLTEQIYTEILAYILERNEYPAGSIELTPDAAGTLGFVGKNGPAQVPEFALIETVGCLTQRDDGIWLLSRSADPIRIRNEAKPSQEELKSSGSMPLGNQTFRLVYPDFEPGFDVGAHKGKKMAAKGFFLINPVDQRLSVKWMGPVGDGCDQ
jgi:mono/diheme cytochrome c family protein